MKMRSFTQLFTGSNGATTSTSDDKKNIRTYKVKKAVDFLSLPEIRDIDAFNTKVKFLQTRGLNEDEVKEAFRLLEKPVALHVDLHAVSGEVIHDESNASSSIALPQNRTSSVSTVFSFCHKLLMFAGIATSCYYLYQQWLAMKAKLSKSKKEDAVIQAELRQIKLEMSRIAADIRQYQGIKDNQTKLLAEVNSLKAILTSRQYFEEKKSTKLTMPPWQCVVTQSQDTPISSTASVVEAQNTSNLDSIQTNGHVDEIEPKTAPRKSKSQNGTSADEKTLDKISNPALIPAVADGTCEIEVENVYNVRKESSVKNSEKKKESKKNDKKNHNSKN